MFLSDKNIGFEQKSGTSEDTRKDLDILQNEGFYTKSSNINIKHFPTYYASIYPYVFEQ